MGQGVLGRRGTGDHSHECGDKGPLRRSTGNGKRGVGTSFLGPSRSGRGNVNKRGDPVWFPCDETCPSQVPPQSSSTVTISAVFTLRSNSATEELPYDCPRPTWTSLLRTPNPLLSPPLSINGKKKKKNFVPFILHT